jgi:alpha-tubulin suppressor-like RCC1 family protein
VALGAGSEHSLVLTQEGRVFQLGYHDVTSTRLERHDSYDLERHDSYDVEGFHDATSSRLAVTHTHQAAINKNWWWIQDRFAPAEVRGALDAVCVMGIACGAQHSIVVTDMGAVFAWGCGGEGRLGLGSRDDVFVPTRVGGLLDDECVIKVCAGSAHSAILTQHAHVYTWGLGDDGRLGHGSTTTLLLPKRVVSLSAVNLACGMNHTAAITQEGHVVTWGAGGHGRLGHGNTQNKLVPFEVRGLRVGVARTMTRSLLASPRDTPIVAKYTFSYSPSLQRQHGASSPLNNQHCRVAYLDTHEVMGPAHTDTPRTVSPTTPASHTTSHTHYTANFAKYVDSQQKSVKLTLVS